MPLASLNQTALSPGATSSTLRMCGLRRNASAMRTMSWSASICEVVAVS
ncbi:hypothetical protein [Streptomyces sp. NBC_00989]|nr:hypothetical protein OG714_51495 [Streptomyces sp. NBC_00989]